MDFPFGFSPDEELPGGHCSRVFADADRVLKIPFQGEELTYGHRATLALQDRGGPKVLASDPETGAVLMERIRPGTTLAESDLDEVDRLPIFVDAVRKLHGATIDGTMPLREYVVGDHPVLRRLHETSPEPIFLHGDLHHSNILAGPDGWVTIDPKGLQGDPAFEAAAWLRNPLDGPHDESSLIDRTLARLPELENAFGWDRWRMVAWCWVDLLVDEDSRDLDHPWSCLRRALDRLI